MSNMGYCRFQNTLRDMYDCLKALQSGDAEDEDLDEDEVCAKKRMKKIAEQLSRII